MRLFAALPIGAAAQDELSRAIHDFRERGWPVRWVREEGLHVTIKFFGEVEAGTLGSIRGALRDATAGTGAQLLAAAEFGVFPDFPRARVIWAGYESEPALELMVHRVEQRAEGLGFAVEGRPFRPHVTLGRLRDGGRLPPEAAALLEREPLRTGFAADRLVLLESRTGPGGSTYTEVDSFPLGS